MLKLCKQIGQTTAVGTGLADGFQSRLFEMIIYYFFDQMSYFTTQEVGNPMQIIKYVELPRFQPILKHYFNFVGSLFTLKTFIGDF